MKYQFTNATVHFAGLEENRQFGKQSAKLIVLGHIDAIVDYAALDYIWDTDDINQTVEQTLTQYLSTPTRFHELSVLTGQFVILRVENEQLVKVITSDSLNPNIAIYYRFLDGQLHISNDFQLISTDLNFQQIDTYNQAFLRHLSKARGGLSGQTYLKEIKKLDARAIYSVRSNQLKKEAVIYPSQFRENMTVDDYLSVIGKKLPEQKYSLAYSTGIDSHVLLEAHKDKIDELCTYYFPYPNLGLEKTKASGASVIQAIQQGMALPKLIEVDECDHSAIDFLQHNAHFQIYTSHFALNFYRLAEEAKNTHLILGEAADAMAGFFTHTNEIYLKTLWSDRKRLLWRLLDNLNFRRKINKKHFADSLEHVLSCYTDDGNLKESMDLSALANIWPMLLYFKSSQTIMNSVATIFAAGDYFQKEIHCPYSEPLVHFAVSQWQKSLPSVFDPKIEIRKKYDYISDEEISGTIHKPSNTIEGSLFDTVLNDLQEANPELSKGLRQTGANKHASVHIACLALQERNQSS